MRKLGIVLCLFCFFDYAFGQNLPNGTTDIYKQTTWDKYNTKYNNPRYVVDEKLLSDSVAKRMLSEVSPYDFVRISVLHASSANERNVVYITTDIVKVQAYQKKLSAFSNEYKSYLETHQNQNGQFLYFINSEPLSGERKDIVDRLYNIPAENIKSVYFTLQEPGTTGWRMLTVTTKQ